MIFSKYSVLCQWIDASGVGVIQQLRRPCYSRTLRICRAKSSSNTAGHMNKVSTMLKSSMREADITCKSQRLMLENGLIQLSSKGIYHMLPLGCRVQEKLVNLIDSHMRHIGGQKISMPCLSPGMLWKATDRWTTQGSELMKLTDRNGIEYTLGPTHEEVVTNLVASQGILTYKQLPLRLYQVGRKFRDEVRPRAGLLRSREFTMKDMYTFDVDEESAMKTYNIVCEAYSELFDQLGMTCLKVLGSSGNIGGTLSHEFHLPSDIGQDTISYCHSCHAGINNVLLELSDSDPKVCPNCRASRISCKSIEVAHTFFLGLKYSQVFMASFKNNTGRTQLMEMGCYGIGVTRLLSACVEVMSSSEDDCIHWPKLIAPYQICIIPPKDGSKEVSATELALSLYTKLQSAVPKLSNEMVYDDRTDTTIGRRATDARKLGYPYIIIVGKKALEEQPLFELEDTHSGETKYLSEDELISVLSRVEVVPLNIL